MKRQFTFRAMFLHKTIYLYLIRYVCYDCSYDKNRVLFLHPVLAIDLLAEDGI